MAKTEAWINVCGGGKGMRFIAGKFSCQASHEMAHGRDLRDHLVQPPHFPEAKESWHSAQRNIKECFRKHIKGY